MELLESILIKSSDLLLNSGQIEGVPKNPRFIRDANFEKLKNSIKEDQSHLYSNELKVYKVGKKWVVLSGNMRFRACKELGIELIPCKVIPQDWTTEQICKEVIISNVSSGEWDSDTLANEWDIYPLDDWGVDLPDFGEDVELEAKDDDYTEPDNLQVDVVLGDLIEFVCADGRVHRLLCGDSTDSDAVAKLMDGKKADMVFTDPPYDLEDNYSIHIIQLFLKENSHGFIMNSDRLLIDNINNNIDYFRKFFSVDFRQARLVSNNQPMTRVDLIAEFCNGKTKFNNTFDGFSTLIECAKIHSDKVEMNHGHKQAKRVELPAKFIEHYSNEKELILDCFLGSGTTLIASHQLNRICYGMEFDPKYCQIIINRMQKLDSSIKIEINGVEYKIDEIL